MVASAGVANAQVTIDMANIPFVKKLKPQKRRGFVHR
jgi:hypothetical protein